MNRRINPIINLFLQSRTQHGCLHAFKRCRGIVSIVCVVLALVCATTRPVVAYAWDSAITFSNVRVGNIGAHTANIAFNLNIDKKKMSQISRLCIIIDTQKFTSIQLTGERPGMSSHLPDYPCVDTTADNQSSSSSYENTYGLKNIKMINSYNSKEYGKAEFYNFQEYYEIDLDGTASGELNLPIFGLQENSRYGNFGLWDRVEILEDNLRYLLTQQADKSNTGKAAVDACQLTLGAHVEYLDGSVETFGENAIRIPDFTTIREPVIPGQGALSNTTANVLSYKGDSVAAGDTARFFLNIPQSQIGERDGGDSYAFWYARIHNHDSTASLKSPNGSPYVSIKKDQQGYFYFEAQIPESYSGDHIVSVQDANGSVRGWTTIVIAPKQSSVFADVSKDTPHVDDIRWLADRGISTGWKEQDGSSTFRGMSPVVRQDMAAFLRREARNRGVGDAASWQPSAADWKRFRDVDRNTPHAEDILWFAHASISEGWKEADGTSTFRGMSPVVRQDMAAFLKRLAARAGKDGGVKPKTDFTDVTAATPHMADVQWLGGSGISQGYRNNDGSWRFEGMTRVYRQDMAAFIHRLDTHLTK